MCKDFSKRYRVLEGDFFQEDCGAVHGMQWYEADMHPEYIIYLKNS
jgi:hypothetical protein